MAWAIYFRLPSHPYLLSEFTVESRNMGNRLFLGWGWWQGVGVRKKNKELEKRQAKLLWVVHYRGKRGDGERLIGWCRQKAKCRSELGKQSGFVVSDSDAFDSWESVTAIMKPSLTYGPKLYSNSTKCHLSSKMHGAGCVCVGLPGICVLVRRSSYPFTGSTRSAHCLTSVLVLFHLLLSSRLPLVKWEKKKSGQETLKGYSTQIHNFTRLLVTMSAEALVTFF